MTFAPSFEDRPEKDISLRLGAVGQADRRDMSASLVEINDGKRSPRVQRQGVSPTGLIVPCNERLLGMFYIEEN